MPKLHLQLSACFSVLFGCQNSILKTQHEYIHFQKANKVFSLLRLPFSLSLALPILFCGTLQAKLRVLRADTDGMSNICQER